MLDIQAASYLITIMSLTDEKLIRVSGIAKGGDREVHAGFKRYLLEPPHLSIEVRHLDSSRGWGASGLSQPQGLGYRQKHRHVLLWTPNG